jgi:quinol monooxygenase YgiN
MLLDRLRNFGVCSEISESAGRRNAWRCRPLNFLSRCFDASFFRDAHLISRWPASCDENGKSLFVQRANDRTDRTLIVFSMQIVAPDEKRTAILRTLGSLLGPTRAAAGCMQAKLYADIDKRKTLFLVEEWESREQFERNLDTAKLNTIVAAIELSSEAPVVRLDQVEREEGVDTLAFRRAAAGTVRH